METKIKKIRRIGPRPGVLVVTLPIDLCKKIGIGEGDLVKISLVDGSLVIKLEEKRMQYCEFKVRDQYGNVFCGRSEGSIGTCRPDLCPLNLEKKGGESQPTQAEAQA